MQVRRTRERFFDKISTDQESERVEQRLEAHLRANRLRNDSGEVILQSLNLLIDFGLRREKRSKLAERAYQYTSYEEREDTDRLSHSENEIRLEYVVLFVRENLHELLNVRRRGDDDGIGIAPRRITSKVVADGDGRE